jgi:hypothetical protein
MENAHQDPVSLDAILNPSLLEKKVSIKKIENHLKNKTSLKVKRSHENFFLKFLPQENFQIIAKKKVENRFKEQKEVSYCVTSKVQEIDINSRGGLIIRTTNSTYLLTIVD